MKHSFSIIILSTVVAIIFILSLIYIIILPYIIPSGIAALPVNGRSLRTSDESVSFKVLKIAHGLPRYHPLHQSLSQEFAVPLENATKLKLIVEIYPEGSLGTDEQLVKGTSRGTIEICLINRVVHDADVGIPPTLVVIATIDSPSRHLWKLKKNAAEYSNVAVLYIDDEVEDKFESLGLKPVLTSGDLLLQNVRNGKVGFVMLDLLEWYYQGWSQWTVSPSLTDLGTTEHLLLVNAEVLNNLDARSHDLLLEYAGRLKEKSEELIRVSEYEILTYAGLNAE